MLAQQGVEPLEVLRRVDTELLLHLDVGRERRQQPVQGEVPARELLLERSFLAGLGVGHPQLQLAHDRQSIFRLRTDLLLVGRHQRPGGVTRGVDLRSRQRRRGHACHQGTDPVSQLGATVRDQLAEQIDVVADHLAPSLLEVLDMSLVRLDGGEQVVDRLLACRRRDRRRGRGPGRTSGRTLLCRSHHDPASRHDAERRHPQHAQRVHLDLLRPAARLESDRRAFRTQLRCAPAEYPSRVTEGGSPR